MENVKINGSKVYKYVTNYKNDDDLRSSFNSLTRKIYGFDFENWYQNGYWGEKYIPYSLVDGDHIISNISVNLIDFLINGEKRTYLQIGTVMTDMKYRNQGLSRILMEKVLEEWRGKCDLIYLFANDTVLNFYPKFGFNTVKEYQHAIKINSEDTTPDFIKLDMSKKENEDFLLKKVNQSCAFSKLSMKDNASLILFYCTSFMNQNVYYIKKFDAIVIAEFSDVILHINDVFCEKEIQIEDIISSLIHEDIKQVILGFTPKNTTTFDQTLLKQDDTLFILDDKWNLFNNEKLRFPLLSHA
jgi:GNAT superfamily N-acetyltransferase